jgi:hypothetical protein
MLNVQETNLFLRGKGPKSDPMFSWGFRQGFLEGKTPKSLEFPANCCTPSVYTWYRQNSLEQRHKQIQRNPPKPQRELADALKPSPTRLKLLRPLRNRSKVDCLRFAMAYFLPSELARLGSVGDHDTDFPAGSSLALGRPTRHQTMDRSNRSQTPSRARGHQAVNDHSCRAWHLKSATLLPARAKFPVPPPGFRTELETLVGDAKGKGPSGGPASPKVLMHRPGSDCSIVVNKRR